MPLIHRLTLICTLPLLALVGGTAGAAEWNPVRQAPPASDTSVQARVVVKYKASATTVKALSVGSATMPTLPQQAKPLGTRLGLTLRDGRGIAADMQLVHASGISSEQLAQRLAQDPNVEWAEPDRRVRPLLVPNDPLFKQGQFSPYPAAGQWYLRTSDSTLVSAINAVAAWDVTQGAGQVVAVLDTGITAHPDLTSVALGGRVLAGYNMISPNNSTEDSNIVGTPCLTGNGLCRTANATDPGDWVSTADHSSYPTLFNNSCLVPVLDSNGNVVSYNDSPSSWHGTQVAGIVGANTGNGVGIAGIAYAAKILPVRVLGKCGGWSTDIIDGMRWAAGLAVTGVPVNPNPAKVINMSLGGPAKDGVCSQQYQAAINEVTALGVVVVVAAGNDGLAVGAPGGCNGVVTVGGVRQLGTKVGFSSLGSAVTLSAPAGNCVNSAGPCLYPIVTTLNDGLTAVGNPSYSDAVTNPSLGTSFSTPQVAGTAALMLAANPQLSSAQVTALLKSTARPFPNTGAPAGSGAGPGGVVQACLAPSSTAQTKECYCTTTPTTTCGAGMLDAAAAVTAAAGVVTVDFTASPASPQAGQSVSLTSNVTTPASRTIKTYLWEVTAGGNLASLTSATNADKATLATTASGSVTVQLTVTDDLLRPVVASKVLTVSAAPAPTPTPTPVPTPTQGGGGGAWSPWWSLGLLLAALALPGRALRRR